MKVLWFTNTSSLFKKDVHYYNGGGWIESLESIISNDARIDLAVSFFHSDNNFKVKSERVTYYPISIYNSLTSRITRNFSAKKTNQIEVEEYLRIIDDFKPDLIHIFGSERSFGLISELTDIPVVIHIQGILNPYLNAWFPPGNNEFDDFIFNDFKTFLKNSKALTFFKRNSLREKKILSNCKFFMGRTSWDKDVIRLISPESRYYRCEEALRNPFYEAAPWQKEKRNKFTITTTISKNSYKGFDVVLKTAKLLKEFTNIDFEWNIYGIDEYKYWSRKLKMNPSDVNVALHGVASAEKLIDALSNSDVFVHPSYIDNSPNSVCEAQMVGLPVISTNAGGISSLIDDHQTGLLVNTNDPFSLAFKIKYLHENVTLSVSLGSNARKMALERHSHSNIHDTIYDTYSDLANKEVVRTIR